MDITKQQLIGILEQADAGVRANVGQGGLQYLANGGLQSVASAVEGCMAMQNEINRLTEEEAKAAAEADEPDKDDKAE